MAADEQNWSTAAYRDRAKGRGDMAAKPTPVFDYWATRIVTLHAIIALSTTDGWIGEIESHISPRVALIIGKQNRSRSMVLIIRYQSPARQRNPKTWASLSGTIQILYRPTTDVINWSIIWVVANSILQVFALTLLRTGIPLAHGRWLAESLAIDTWIKDARDSPHVDLDG